MDLLCTEEISSTDNDTVAGQRSIDRSGGLLSSRQMEVRLNTAVKDPVFLEDRCLENLLKAETRLLLPTLPDFEKVQKDFRAKERRVVVEWLSEVCEEQKCQEEVFPLCISYLDRVFSLVPIKKTCLQILATACLLLASKLREPNYKALPVELLVFYTDHSITKKELIQWELIVLNLLKWDVSTVTPLDFLELLLCRLPIENKKCHDITIEKVRKHAQAFISLAAREYYFSNYTASTVAASSIAASLSGLKWHQRSGQSISNLVDRFTDLTGVEQEFICECMTKMEELFQVQMRWLPDSLHNASVMAPFVSQQQHLQQPCINPKNSSTTPTDVQDIDF